MRAANGWRMALIAALAMASAQPAHAAGWVHLPNGKIAYQTDYTSSAMFTCSRWIIVGSCSAVANSVTLTNGGSQLTLSWQPSTSPLNLGFYSAPPFVMGTIQKTVTGTGPFVLPTLANPKGPLFDMKFDITTEAFPPSGSQAIFFSFVIQSPTMLRVGGNSTWHQLGWLRASPSLSGSAWIHARTPSFDTTEGEVQVLATSGISTPEPASLFLLGSGMLGVAGIVRRRRKTSVGG
ncbi:MAG: PEP-CTERM sorting domain-containing protein [Gemmatimonadota bacterium]